MIRPVVMKFGGASLACAGSILRVADLVQQQQKYSPVLVIVSGCGNVTNELESMLTLSSIDSRRQVLAEIQGRHFAMLAACATSLQAESETTDIKQKIAQLCADAWHQLEQPLINESELLTLGERLSAQIVVGILQVLGLSCGYFNATEFIYLEGDKAEHKPDLLKTTRLCQQGFETSTQVHVSEGFIACDSAGAVATLGRNGSDTTAAIWAVALGAARLEIWKEVDGLFDADPNVVTQAKLITDIAFDDLCQLSQFGSSVIHYPALQLLKNQRLILSLKCPKNPHSPKATHIHFGGARPDVTALAVLNGIQLLPHRQGTGLFCIDKGNAELRFVMELALPAVSLQRIITKQQSEPLSLITLFSNQVVLQPQDIELQLKAAGGAVVAVYAGYAADMLHLVVCEAQKVRLLQIVHGILRQYTDVRTEENDVF